LTRIDADIAAAQEIKVKEPGAQTLPRERSSAIPSCKFSLKLPLFTCGRMGGGGNLYGFLNFLISYTDNFKIHSIYHYHNFIVN
jgi:hypothetical protein